jgi:hypothetical protein
MPDRVRHHRDVAPARRVRRNEGYFFPGEVVRLLDLGDIDYHQLRRIYTFSRRQAGVALRKGWARYTLHDLARVSATIRIAGGPGALRAGHRLQLDPVERACDALRTRGFPDPLLQIPMVRDGKNVFAVIDGAVVDPTTGQALLDGAWSATTAFLQSRAIADNELAQALLHEQGQGVRPPQQLPPAEVRVN